MPTWQLAGCPAFGKKNTKISLELLCCNTIKSWSPSWFLWTSKLYIPDLNCPEFYRPNLKRLKLYRFIIIKYQICTSQILIVQIFTFEPYTHSPILNYIARWKGVDLNTVSLVRLKFHSIHSGVILLFESDC